MDWYPYFLGVIFLLWVFAAPKDRNALRVVLIASLFSEALVVCVTHAIHGAWKLGLYSGIEMLTIIALVRVRGRTAYIQAFILIFAWLAEMLCYMDIQLKTDFVYSRYEAIILVVAIAQIAGFHETFSHITDLARAGAASIRGGSMRAFRTASRCHNLSPDGSNQVVSQAGKD